MPNYNAIYTGLTAADKSTFWRTSKCYFRRCSKNLTFVISFQSSVILFFTHKFVNDLIAIYKPKKALDVPTKQTMPFTKFTVPKVN